MSAINLDRPPDLKIKGGSAVPLTITFRDSTGALYTPSTAPTMLRTRGDGTNPTAVTMTFVSLGTYTINDLPPSDPNQQIYVYEWKGIDASKPQISGDYIVQVGPSSV